MNKSEATVWEKREFGEKEIIIHLNQLAKRSINKKQGRFNYYCSFIHKLFQIKWMLQNNYLCMCEFVHFIISPASFQRFCYLEHHL